MLQLVPKLAYFFLDWMAHYKLIIIRHVPIFTIFVSVLDDEFTYWQNINTTDCMKIFCSLWKKVFAYRLNTSLLHLLVKHRMDKDLSVICLKSIKV